MFLPEIGGRLPDTNDHPAGAVSAATQAVYAAPEAADPTAIRS